MRSGRTGRITIPWGGCLLRCWTASPLRGSTRRWSWTGCASPSKSPTAARFWRCWRSGCPRKNSPKFFRVWPNHADFSVKFAVSLKPFVILLFASFSSFARRKRRQGSAPQRVSERNRAKRGSWRGDGGSPDWHKKRIWPFSFILTPLQILLSPL